MSTSSLWEVLRSKIAALFRPHSVFMLAVWLSLGSVSASAEDWLSARVARVIDGDTFALEGVTPKIRIWGLDAPERGQTGGAKATAALRRLIAGQKLDCLVRDIDRYDRIVGQCALADGRDIAAWMIGLGVADEFCRYSRGYYGTC